MPLGMERDTFNAMQMATGFMLIFCAFNTQSFIVETVLENRHKTDPSIPKHAGYYSQTIMYAAHIASNLLAPPIISMLGCKWCLVVGSAVYTIFMAGFLHLNIYFLYCAAFVEGLGAGILWTAMGHYLALNSNEKTIGRNSGFVWIIYMSCLIVGGVFLVIVFGQAPNKDISMETTRVIYGGFTAVALAGNVVFALLQTPERERQQREKSSYVKELVSTFRLVFAPDLLLLAFAFAFTGMGVSFWSGVYPTSLSFTRLFSRHINTNMLMALNSIAVGCGELSGGFLFGLFGYRTNKFGRYPIVILGLATALCAYVLVYVNIPYDANYEETHGKSLIEPNIAIALFCGFLLGFSDSCINTQIYSFLAVLRPQHTSHTYAIYKFYHAALSCVCMFYGSAISLYWQLGLLAAVYSLSAIGFTIVERRVMRSPQSPI